MNVRGAHKNSSKHYVQGKERKALKPFRANQAQEEQLDSSIEREYPFICKMNRRDLFERIQGLSRPLDLKKERRH
jgi:hypothetical protein